MANATLEMSPTQWANAEDIREVEPINDGDLDCLAEVQQVLKRYGKSGRFGVMLIKQPFDIASDETLVEYTNVEGRTLVIKPVKAAAVGTSVETSWALGDGDPRAMLVCNTRCEKSSQGTHLSTHV